MKSKVLVFGSNVSADIVNHHSGEGKFELVEHYTRSSLASVTSEPIRKKPSLEGLSSSQKRALKRDFSKEFIQQAVSKASYHLLLIDFLDERFHLLENNDFIATRTVEFVSSKSRLNGFKLIEAYSEEYFQMWLKGWHKFLETMKRLKLLNRIRLNKIFRVLPETKVDEEKSAVVKHNQFLARLYKEAEKSLNANQVYNYPEKFFDRKSYASESQLGDYSEEFYLKGNRQLVHDKGLADLLDNIITSTPKLKMSFKEKVLKYISQDLPFTLLKKNAIKKLKTSHKKEIATFVKSEIFNPGVNSLSFGTGQVIEFLYNNPNKLNTKDRKLLVCFNAAVGQRDVKCGPFFSGIGLSDELGLPILSIADPLVSQNENIGLAWYAGGENSNGLQLQLTELLEQVYKQHGLELIIFGGSGGGFASLVQATRLTIPATIVVWNPQTSILNYLKEPVSDYVNTAFREFRAKADFSYKQTLDWFGIQHEVFADQVKEQIKLVYLQNQSDNHRNIHAIPFMKAECWTRIGSASFESSNQKLLMCFGNWGRGHVAPSKPLLTALFNGIVFDKHQSHVIHSLADIGPLIDDRLVPYINVSEFSPNVKIKLNTCRSGETIKCWADIAGNELDIKLLKYSFRLHVNGKPILGCEYQSDSNYSFEYDKDLKNLRVELRIQDKLGTILRLYADVK
ncbi:hypothetical protein LP316_08530 [Thalassotalea sp. LPB0316]|uniref:DUF6270 domain-containing protein n=1 Tax=Thalassotalea sp. LPB0316 TaxID=2769490 RepID=UPI001868A0C2|nr:DUF6270 domain-containing protein [Thalassotalea sp. LPB0316]QOL24414.1 hypothetical protein LP316_08530 [Thalassotalea sp. LPB0316]